MPEKPESAPGPGATAEYIAGVYNYCDRWCNACPVSGRCRIFSQEPTASVPGHDRGIEQASWAVQVGHWLQRALSLLQERIGHAALTELPGGDAAAPTVTAFAHGRLLSRADAYLRAVTDWQSKRPLEAGGGALDPVCPQDVIDHLAPLVASKIRRAITSLAWEQADGWTAGELRDSDGSAKVALLGIERSHAAWLDLRDSGLASDASIDACCETLQWLRAELDALFPEARRFIRPGLDSDTR